jgi:hypothetical protein
MIAAAFLSLLLQAAEPAKPEPATAGQQAVSEHPVTLYNFYRAQVFHDMAVRGDCLRLHPERTRDLNARFEAARTRLAALVGPGVVDQPSDRPAADGGDCASGGILFGYEDKIVFLERNLAGGAP